MGDIVEAQSTGLGSDMRFLLQLLKERCGLELANYRRLKGELEKLEEVIWLLPGDIIKPEVQKKKEEVAKARAELRIAVADALINLITGENEDEDEDKKETRRKGE